MESLKLPDKPEGPCDEAVQKQINRAFEKASKMTFNESLARNKNFQNPHVLDLLSDVFEVDMMGSNFHDKFDPKAYPKSLLRETTLGIFKFCACRCERENAPKK